MRKLLAVAAVALVSGACSQKKETAAPKADKTVNIAKPKQAASQPANPHGKEFAQKGPAGKPVTGLVKLDEGVDKASLKPTDVLFIMARESQGNGRVGRLLGVQRHGKLSAESFPLRYEMSAKNVMVPGVPFKGPFILMARLDKDGDPMTKGEDDLYAVITTPTDNGATGAHLVLKKGKPKVIKAPAGHPGAGHPGAHGQKPASQPSSKPAAH